MAKAFKKGDAVRSSEYLRSQYRNRLPEFGIVAAKPSQAEYVAVLWRGRKAPLYHAVEDIELIDTAELVRLDPAAPVRGTKA